MPFHTQEDPRKLTRSIGSVINTFSKVSTTTFFKVTFPINGGLKSWLNNTGIYDFTETDGLDGMEKIELLCSEAILPGPSFKKTEILGNRQGMRESYPVLRAFPEVQLTFYVDKQHAVIRFFEEWCNYINPLYDNNRVIQSSRRGQNDSGAFNNNATYKMKYPDSYCQNFLITKFEKDLTNVYGGSIANSAYYTYEFLRAYPSSVLAAPVSYQGSQVLKYTVVFDYMRYITRRTPQGATAFSFPIGATSTPQNTETQSSTPGTPGGTTNTQRLVPVKGNSGVVFYDATIDTRTSAEVSGNFFNSQGLPVIN